MSPAYGSYTTVAITDSIKSSLANVFTNHMFYFLHGDVEEIVIHKTEDGEHDTITTWQYFKRPEIGLLLCSFWILEGRKRADDVFDKECRLLGYKNRVCTSQETHYVSTTEPSRLMLCKI
jgi:hypothetical protein